MTIVNLKIKQEDGSVKPVQHEIEEIDLDQFQMAMVTIKQVMQTLAENPALFELFMTAIEDSGEEDESIDQRFLTMATSAFEVLFVEMPDHAFDLVATLSGIEKAVLKKQKMMTVPAIYDGILEANDFEELYKRVKKSLGATKIKLAWVNKSRKATKKKALASV